MYCQLLQRITGEKDPTDAEDDLPGVPFRLKIKEDHSHEQSTRSIYDY